MQSTHTDKRDIAVIGLGNMGWALANAFLHSGHRVSVWNRSVEKVGDLVAKGAVQATTVTEAIKKSQIIVVCVSTYEVMHALLEPTKDDLEGKTLVNLTTGTPKEARHTAEWAKKHSIHYLDGAIMAIPMMIGQPETLIFYGGSEELFQSLKPELTILGGNSVYLDEDPGVPLVYDMALLTMLYGSWYSYLHAHALLRKANVTAEMFLPYASSWIEHVISPALTDPEEAQALDERNYSTEESNLTVNKQALDHIIRSSTELGIPVEWLMPIQQLANKKLSEGYGNDSFTRIFDSMTSLVQ